MPTFLVCAILSSPASNLLYEKNMSESSRIAKRVLLIGWDAADWQLIDKYVAEGAMPYMQQFLERGSRGNLATLKPQPTHFAKD